MDRSEALRRQSFRPRAIPESSRCTNCRQHWAQHQGLCRRCGRALGLYDKTTRQLDAERLQRQLAALVRVPDEQLQPRPPKPITVHGRAYEVVWDGA